MLPAASTTREEPDGMARIEKTDAEWRAELTARDYEITRRAGTEPPFTGVYWNTKTPGIYNGKCCAPIAMPTWGTCFPTARRRPGCVSA